MNGLGSTTSSDKTEDSDLLAGLLEKSSMQWEDLLGEGATVAYTNVASGVGGRSFQSWRPFPGRPLGQNAIAEVRSQVAERNLEFRFGVDVSTVGRTGREAAWDLATTLDGAIRADTFAAHLREVDPDRVELLLPTRGSGRPSAKGDWEEIVAKGFVRGDASHFNPGFHYEGDTRYVASARIDAARATGPDLIALLRNALFYLTGSLAVS
jgi:hypothetical protein